MRSSLFRRTAFLVLCSSGVDAQQPQAKELLARALHLADLYNWADAAPAFTEAEQLFVSAGDQRNALYAKLGRIRSNIEREQKTLPMVSSQLAKALEDDPLLQNDKELRKRAAFAIANIVDDGGAFGLPPGIFGPGGQFGGGHAGAGHLCAGDAGGDYGSESRIVGGAARTLRCRRSWVPFRSGVPHPAH